MRLRILFLILGIAWKSWAQCPTADKVLGTRQTGRLGIKINDQNASTKVVPGTASDIIKICKGNTLYVEDLTQGNDPGLSGYYFEYNSASFDLRTAEPAGKVLTKSHVYNTSGTFALILTGAAGTGYYACQTVQVTDNPKPVFTAKSCSNRQVTIEVPKDAAKNPYDTFIINWGDGTSKTLTQDKLPYSETYTYASGTPSNVKIEVTGGYTGSGCTNTSDPVEVNINTPATFTPAITELELARDRKAVTIQFVGSTTFTQNVYQKEVNGTYQATGLGSGNGGATSLTVNQLDPTKQYCFQVRTEVPVGCGNSGVSPEICTVPLRLTSTTTQIDQTWTTYPNAADFESYTLSGGTKPDQTFRDITKVKETDADVVCGKEYCYKVTVTLKNGVKTISNAVCDDIDSNSKPESIADGYATVSGQGTLVDWKIPGGGQSLTDRIRKAEANGAFQNIPTSEVKKPFPDAAVEVNRLSYCYQVAYQSTCRTNSDFSGSFCTIHAIQQGDRIQWTSASPFLDKLAGYQVQVVDAQGNVIQSQNVGLQTSVSINSLGPIQSGYQYRIRALSENGNVSVSNLISVTESVRIYVPQAFTPNGDTQNEVFLPTMLNVTQMKLVIFDRWGNPIFASEDMNRGWDGNVNGRPAPVGSYSYRVDIRNDAGNSFTKRGTFQLIR